MIITFNTYFTLANAPGGINPLPVEFVSFTGKALNTSSQLNWSTASETNSDYFEVQRSVNGVDFVNVGTVAAAGFTTDVKQYSFTDHHPAAGYNYYRLRQVDRDGAEEMTNIVAVYFTKRSMAVFPNPAHGTQLTVQLPDENTAIQRAVLFDLSGKQIQSLSTDNFGGVSNTLTFADQPMPGTYMLQVMDAAGISWTEKIVIAD